MNTQSDRSQGDPAQGQPEGDAPQVAAWAGVRQAIAMAARDAGRPEASVTLTAVSKTVSAEGILPVIAAGQRTFGENRVQEAQGKWPALRALWPDLRLHLIGPLQSNKAREAAALFDVIETVDREKIARALADEIARSGRAVECLIQVNTGDEPQKAGISPRDADAFVAFCQQELKLPVAGLMCIPPAQDLAAPHFALLAKIAKAHGLARLSMGMSADFAIAIQLGATHVRVGSAIFGARQS